MGYRNRRQMNPLKGIAYVILCFLFGSAMYLLGKGSYYGTWDDKILAVVFFVVAIAVWVIAVMLILDLWKYFKSN